MVEIYRSAFGYFARSLPFLLAIAALLEGLTLLLPSAGMQGSRWVALLVMAYLFHRHFLFGEVLTWKKPDTAAPPIKFGWFLTANLALILAPVALAFLLASLLVGPISTTPTEVYVGALLLVLFPLYLVSLSLFGMGLPALVARNRAYRLTTGLKVSPRIALGLILGPGLTGGLLLALTLLFAARFGDLPDHSPVSQWVLGTVITTLGFLPTILAVAVLCHAYRRAHPSEA